ncbi:hydrogenase expression/formation protein HypE [Oscillospiraceae bacterium LTW-04]|nr:hydrogenase expression/formation protein HypE [Oscillospiraceae bacterium MB24-C1]
MDQKITLRHGDGGLHTNRLIRDIFYKHFKNEILSGYQDSAIFTMEKGRLAFTTDSFVVKPIFFPGGDIGKLAVCGTVNDLAAAGALPLYISTGFVIEEGFEIEKLDAIAASMSRVCKLVGAKIVAGDTKVVEKGLVDGVYINTSGIGRVHEHFHPRPISSGDEIILTGSLAEHGTTILLKRYALGLKGDFISDCNPLSQIITALGDSMKHIKLMRDPTRGGVATALCEISESHHIGAIIEEDKLQIRPAVNSVHEILGTDPLYFASEGRMILVAKKGYGIEIVNILKRLENCCNCDVIGVFNNTYNKICIRTSLGGERIVSMLENQMISRIC